MTELTLEDIERAHEGVRPEEVGAYADRLLALGVVSATTHVSDGHASYEGPEGSVVETPAAHPLVAISANVDPAGVKMTLDLVGKGQMDYDRMVRRLGASGVAGWVVKPEARTMTYVALSGEAVLEEAL